MHEAHLTGKHGLTTSAEASRSTVKQGKLNTSAPTGGGILRWVLSRRADVALFRPEHGAKVLPPEAKC